MSREHAEIAAVIRDHIRRGDDDVRGSTVMAVVRQVDPLTVELLDSDIVLRDDQLTLTKRIKLELTGGGIEQDDLVLIHHRHRRFIVTDVV